MTGRLRAKLVFARVYDLRYVLLAFIFPFAVRLVPEIIAWPYPLGFDTLGYYIPAMRWWINPFSGQALPTDVLGIMKSAALFYVVADAFNRYLVNDLFFAVKVLGPLLTAFVSLSAYGYGRLSLRWCPWKALLASLVATLYFIGLRISWELYRNMLGVVFLFAALVALEATSGARRCGLVPLFALLTFMSHQITGVLLLGIFFLHGLWLFAKRRFEELRLQICFFAIALGLLLYMLWVPQIGKPFVPVAFTGSRPSLESVGYVLGFLIYCFIFLLPLALIGTRLERGTSLRFWIASCLLVLVPVLTGGLNSIPLWFRWPLMLVYPLAFFFAEGFECAIRFRSWRSLSGLVVKIGALSLVALIAVTSVYYLVAPPEHPFPYFSQHNPYLRYVESSMLQNSISIQDVPSLLSAIDAASLFLDNGTVLVLHEAVYVWAVNRLGTTTRVIPVKEPGYVSMNPENASRSIEQLSYANHNSGHRVYTIWWSDGRGWYTVGELPASFRLVEKKGTFGIYLFEPD